MDAKDSMGTVGRVDSPAERDRIRDIAYRFEQVAMLREETVHGSARWATAYFQ